MQTRSGNLQVVSARSSGPGGPDGYVGMCMFFLVGGDGMDMRWDQMIRMKRGGSVPVFRCRRLDGESAFPLLFPFIAQGGHDGKEGEEVGRATVGRKVISCGIRVSTSTNTNSAMARSCRSRRSALTCKRGEPGEVLQVRVSWLAGRLQVDLCFCAPVPAPAFRCL